MFYFIYFSYILECIIMYQWQNGSTSPGDTDLQSTFDSRQKSIHIRRFCVLCAKKYAKMSVRSHFTVKRSHTRYIMRFDEEYEFWQVLIYGCSFVMSYDKMAHCSQSCDFLEGGGRVIIQSFFLETNSHNFLSSYIMRKCRLLCCGDE